MGDCGEWLRSVIIKSGGDGWLCWMTEQSHNRVMWWWRAQEVVMLWTLFLHVVSLWSTVIFVHVRTSKKTNNNSNKQSDMKNSCAQWVLHVIYSMNTELLSSIQKVHDRPTGNWLQPWWLPKPAYSVHKCSTNELSLAVLLIHIAHALTTDGSKLPLVQWSTTTKTDIKPAELSLPLVCWTSSCYGKCRGFSEPLAQREKCLYLCGLYPWVL